MKMLKILGKVTKLYLVIDTVLSVVALVDYYNYTKGWEIDHDNADYVFNPVTKTYMNAYDYKARKLGLIADDTKDEEDHLDILDVEKVNKIMA